MLKNHESLKMILQNATFLTKPQTPEFSEQVAVSLLIPFPSPKRQHDIASLYPWRLVRNGGENIVGFLPALASSSLAE